MLRHELLDVARSLDDVDVMTPGPGSDAPEIAWGDSFITYTPPERLPGDAREFPFATVVTKDYPDFDTTSELDRDGAWRVNLNVGRHEYERLFGHRPGEYDSHRDAFDPAARDVVMPHPVYASQAWASIINPERRAGAEAIRLLHHAYERAVQRHQARIRRETTSIEGG